MTATKAYPGTATERHPDLGTKLTMALVFLVPVAIAPGVTYDAFNLPKLALLLLAVPVVLLIAARAGFEGWRPILIPAVALTAPLVVSWLASPYRGWAVMGRYTSYQGLVPYLLVAGLGVAIAVVFRRDAWLPVATLVAAGALGSVYAIAQRLGLDVVDWSRYGGVLEGSAFFGNPNYAGSFFAVVAPLALVAIARGNRVLFGGAFLLLCGGLVAAASEGAVLGAIGGCCVAGGSLLRSRSPWAYVAGAASAALCALLIVGAVGAGLASDAVADRSEPIRDRGHFWVAAGGTLLNDPLVGNGPNSFAIEGTSHRPIEQGIASGFGFTNDPHSAPLALASSNGIVALVGFVVVFVWVLKAGVSAPLNLARTAAFGGAIAYFIQSLWATEQLPVRFAFWVCIGVLAATRSQTSEGRLRRRAMPPLAGALAVVFLVASISGYRLFDADRHVWAGIQARADGDLPGSVSAFARAVDARPDPEYRYLLGGSLGQLSLGSDDLDAVIPALDQAFAYVDEVPDVRGLATWASWVHRTAAGSTQREEKALALYTRAIERDPVNPLIKVGVSDVLIALGRPEEAHDLLIPLFFHFPPQAEFWGALALANVLLGNTESARSYMNSAFERDAEDPRAQATRELLEREANS